ncbi:coiled-coil domain-containing protein 33 [Dromiciops gliroides]|uniref:coiled-coil domain-containing protein 33 n=1 Tax=Dromiciops gliroides TaxID=33562 RepID=UPI001CC7BEF1|nr:coiled-coil domain-containing protein 33 [Dromiciops gliroides]
MGTEQLAQLRLSARQIAALASQRLLGVRLPKLPSEVAEPPLPLEEAFRHAETTYGHLAPAQKEIIIITLHGAINLPSQKNGSKPLAFVIAKTTSQEEKHQESTAVTSTTWEPTKSPTWETTVKLEIQTEDVGHEEVILKVLDSRTRDLLASYRIPIKYLRPFHPYHFELVTAHKAGLAKLYASITRESSFMPRYIGCTHTALEVFLQGVNEPLANPFGPIMVVARIIPNYKEFKETTLSKDPISMGLPMRTVNFPSPSVLAFDVPRTNEQGYPQVSKPGGPARQPEWNTSFLYQARNGCTQFSEDLALLLEFYPMLPMHQRESWNLVEPLGISVLPLNNRVYRKMMSGSQTALHVKKLPILRTKLKTIAGGTPTVNLTFQVLSSERPDNFLTPNNCADVPVLNPTLLDADLGIIRESWSKDFVSPEPESESEPLPEPESEPELELVTELEPKPKPKPTLFYVDKCLSVPSLEEVKPLELPQETLEDFSPWPHQKVIHKTQSRPQPFKVLSREEINEYSRLPNTEVHLYSSIYYSESSDTQDEQYEVEEKPKPSDIPLSTWKEVDNYQRAMTKMANDILTLRRQVSSLETENNSLRRQVTTQEQMGQASAEDEEMIANMKQKLSQSTMEMRRLKARVQQLQNELIRKNDREKDLLLIQQSHHQQQQNLKKYHDKLQKMKGLEQTVKNQEKVIQTMEKILEEKVNQPSRERSDSVVSPLGRPLGKHTGPMGESVPFDFYSILLSENARLRSELDKNRHQSSPIILQQQALPGPVTKGDPTPNQHFPPSPPSIPNIPIPSSKSIHLPGVYSEIIIVWFPYWPDLCFCQQDFLSGTSDKFNLMAKLESAQNRIRTLESELEDSARRWGQEKQELTSKLMEQDHGFILGSSPMSTEHQRSPAGRTTFQKPKK